MKGKSQLEEIEIFSFHKIKTEQIQHCLKSLSLKNIDSGYGYGCLHYAKW